MFYRKPPGDFIFGAGRPANPDAGFGPGFNSYDANNLMTPLVATPRPQPMPQPVTLPNSGYPVLDLISGLSQVFTRPKPTMAGYPDPTPTFPETTDYGWPEDGGIWEKPPQRPRPPLSGDFGPTTLFPKPWNDDAGQNDWLTRWNIQPAQDARYLPSFPETEDNTTGAQLSRNWHNAYKDYAFGQIKDNAPQFVEHMPEPKPEQSYGDFMGDVKNTASTLVNQAAGFLGSGIGQALGFIPGVGAVMELIGKGANLAGTVAGATGLGGEKAGTALNLLGSVANGAAGGANTANAEEYGPPMPGADQMPQETYGPAMPPFKNPTAPSQDSWLQQQLKEMNERQARGETLDDKGNWQQGPNSNNSPPPTLSGKKNPSTEDEARFDEVLPIIKGNEGGFSDRPKEQDKGGPTQKGISTGAYKLWLKRKDVNATEWPTDVKDLSDDQIRTIYRNEYYYDKRLDEIEDPKMRAALFDAYVMSKPPAVYGMTEQAIKKVIPDANLGVPGVLGKNTIGALNQINKEGRTNEYLEALADARRDYYKSQPEYKYNPGWLPRVDSFRPSNPSNIYDRKLNKKK
ncbi:MAG: hypothetical protein EYC62_01050 [Alphaproteobacteria bacterium]|nr:MAG: hypothetical protein EYC62_01050 [Alphaproteobacteria bacterium]